MGKTTVTNISTFSITYQHTQRSFTDRIQYIQKYIQKLKDIHLFYPMPLWDRKPSILPTPTIDLHIMQ